MKEIASKLFHGKEGFNCAQAILKCFQQELKIPESSIDEGVSIGGGRAPQNICGALYAGLSSLNCHNQKKKLTDDFLKSAGSVECRIIKSEKKISCRQCVEITAESIDTILKGEL